MASCFKAWEIPPPKIFPTVRPSPEVTIVKVIYIWFSASKIVSQIKLYEVSFPQEFHCSLIKKTGIVLHAYIIKLITKMCIESRWYNYCQSGDKVEVEDDRTMLGKENWPRSKLLLLYEIINEAALSILYILSFVFIWNIKNRKFHT